MLRLAFGFELRSLARSRASQGALLAFLLVGALALTVGERFVSQWETAIDSAQDAESASVALARSALEAGRLAPEGNARANLSQPHWLDRYAATRFVRQPSGLAGIAAGAVDSAPAAFHVHRRAQPASSGGYRIENPELAVGTIDLTFVLTMLIPLLVGVLGVGIGPREREAGMESLIVIQAGSSLGWWVGRAFSVAVIASGASAVLCIAAGIVGGASAAHTASLVAFAATYAMLWSGLLLATTARSETIQTAAFRFGMLWTLVCVLVPALAAERALSNVESDFSVEETVDARDERWAANGASIDSQLNAFYALYPELATAPAASARLSRLELNYLRGALEAQMSAAAASDGILQQERALASAEHTAWLSPRLAFTLASERLAGVGTEATVEYRRALGEAVSARVDWVSTNAWERRALGAQDLEALLASAPEPFVAEPKRLGFTYLMLFVWTVFAWGFAARGLRRTHRLVAPRGD